MGRRMCCACQSVVKTGDSDTSRATYAGSFNSLVKEGILSTSKFLDDGLLALRNRRENVGRLILGEPVGFFQMRRVPEVIAKNMSSCMLLSTSPALDFTLAYDINIGRESRDIRMSDTELTLSVRPRGKPVNKLPEEISLAVASNTSELYGAIASAANISIHRLRITKGSDNSHITNSHSVAIRDVGLRQQSQIYVKDLGPQIAWKTVFLIEYLGPILIHPLLYILLPSISLRASLSSHKIVHSSNRPSFDPRSPTAHASTLQTLTLLLTVIHFSKREFETLFIHRFSNSTMPLFNIFKNSAHYWFLSGILMALSIYRGDSVAATLGPKSLGEGYPLLTGAGLALFTLGELGNLIDHLVLMNLRTAGSTKRGIPRGLAFDLVTCPNYMFETIAWAGILLISADWSTALFVLVAVGQMAPWAWKKERRYRKEFGAAYTKKRYAMIPGLI